MAKEEKVENIYRLAKRILLVIIYNFVLIFIILFGFYTVKAKIFYDAHRILISENNVLRFDPLLGFSLYPNLNLRQIYPNIDLFTDNIGARVDRPGITCPKKVDILGIGCSFTWEDSVNYEKTYLSLLAKKTGLIVSNLAKPSYGATAAFLSLEKYKYLSPKIVIYGFIEGHMRRMLSPCAPCEFSFCRPSPFVNFNPRPYIQKPSIDEYKIYFRYQAEVMSPHKFGLIDIYWAFKTDLVCLTKTDSIGLNERFTNNYPRSEEALRYLIEKMILSCKELKAKLIIIYIPNPNLIDPPSKEFSHVIEKFTDSKNIFFVDVTKSFHGYAKKFGQDKLKSMCVPMRGNNYHPSEQAHQLIVDALLPIIKGIVSDSM